jgi:hypothetical protein
MGGMSANEPAADAAAPDDRRTLKVSGPVFELVRDACEKLGLIPDALLGAALPAYLDRTQVAYLAEEPLLIREMQQLELILMEVLNSNLVLAEVVHGLDGAALRGLLETVQNLRATGVSDGPGAKPEAE